MRWALALWFVSFASCSEHAAMPDAAPPDGGPDAAAPPEPGLRAAYFHRHGPLVLDRIDRTVDFAWGDAGPAPEVGADRFSVRWTGELDVPTAGDYTFVVTADDGVRLWIGDTRVIDDWTFHSPTRVEGTAALDAGPVPLRLEYFEKDVTAEVHLAWRGDGLDEQVIPADRLRAAAAAPASAPKPPYDNPVVPVNCPDPGVLAAPDATGARYYMVCTGGSFRIRRSADLVLWDDTGHAIFPAGKPPWALNGGRNWAPELHRVGDRYIAYYTSVDADNRLAIGAAWSLDPLGPYTDAGAPLVQDPLGAIDATYFRDDNGRHYLIYKLDGNAQARPTPILARELAPDGLGFAAGSAARQLLVNEPATWEGGVIEAPWIVKRDGRYYLFYSGNVYDARYRTGVARASSLLGPYQKRGAPVLANNPRWVGPGHGSVVAIDGVDYFLYHAWTATPQGGHDSAHGRQVLLDRIDWVDGWSRIGDGTPSRTLQPWPGAPPL